jgi:hypothetical protein
MTIKNAVKPVSRAVLEKLGTVQVSMFSFYNLAIEDPGPVL